MTELYALSDFENAAIVPQPATMSRKRHDESSLQDFTSPLDYHLEKLQSQDETNNKVIHTMEPVKIKLESQRNKPKRAKYQTQTNTSVSNGVYYLPQSSAPAPAHQQQQSPPQPVVPQTLYYTTVSDNCHFTPTSSVHGIHPLLSVNDAPTHPSATGVPFVKVLPTAVGQSTPPLAGHRSSPAVSSVSNGLPNQIYHQLPLQTPAVARLRFDDGVVPGSPSGSGRGGLSPGLAVVATSSPRPPSHPAVAARTSLSPMPPPTQGQDVLFRPTVYDDSTTRPTPAISTSSFAASAAQQTTMADHATYQQQATLEGAPPPQGAAGRLSASMVPVSLHQQERIKLNRKRERNRLAAAKCRQRKLEKIDDLQKTVNDLKDTNQRLRTDAQKLREQVVGLKSLIVNHTTKFGCKIFLPDHLSLTIGASLDVKAGRGGGDGQGVFSQSESSHRSSAGAEAYTTFDHAATGQCATANNDQFSDYDDDDESVSGNYAGFQLSSPTRAALIQHVSSTMSQLNQQQNHLIETPVEDIKPLIAMPLSTSQLGPVQPSTTPSRPQYSSSTNLSSNCFPTTIDFTQLK